MGKWCCARSLSKRTRPGGGGRLKAQTVHQTNVLNPDAPSRRDFSVPLPAEESRRHAGFGLFFPQPPSPWPCFSIPPSCLLKPIAGLLVNEVCDFYLKQTENMTTCYILKRGEGIKKDGREFFKIPGENNSEYRNLYHLVIGSYDVATIRLGTCEAFFKCGSE